MTETNTTTNAEAEEQIVITKESIKIKNKMVCGVLVAILTISFVIGLSMLIWYIMGIESKENSKSNALDEINGIGKYVNNFTESDHDTFDHGFDVFDTNDDGSLNMQEFRILFEMQLDNASAFERMDIDNDGILSYAECVTRLKYGSIGVLDSWIDSLSPLIYEKYGYNHSDSSISNTDLFFEYVAIMMYFEIFDTDNNGYIHKTEWISISSQNEFIANDIDSDGEITEEEFLNLIYGTDEKSWKGLIDRSVKSSKITVINTQMVKEVQMVLNLCPTQMHAQLAQNMEDRRRLGEVGWYTDSEYGVTLCRDVWCGYGFMNIPCWACYDVWFLDFRSPTPSTCNSDLIQEGDRVSLIEIWWDPWGCFD